MLVVLATLLSGCSNQPASTVDSAKVDTTDWAGMSDNYDEEITVEVFMRNDVPKEYVMRLRDELLKERFNMVWVESYVSSSDMATKLSTLYAAGKEPDLIWAVQPAWGSAEWTEAGYFRGCTYDEIVSLIPSYETLWDIQNETAWEEYIFPYLVHSDGLLYTLPYSRDTAGNMAWCYRQEVFDRCGITQFPTNPEEFLEVCRIIKAEEGITPLVDTNTTILFVPSKWGMMYGLPEMLPDMPCFKNPLTGEMYYYVYASDTYRELMILANTLVTEGLMYEEFATASSDQRDAYISQGHKALQLAQPASIPSYNALQVDAAPDVNWVWTDTIPTTVPGKYNIKKDNYHAASLRAFAASATDEQVKRCCDFFEWCLSEEGLTFTNYGVEGVTYDIIDGVKTIKPEFATPLQATGIDLETYQLQHMMWRHTEYISHYRPVLTEWTERILHQEGAVYVMPPIMRFTEEETAQFTDMKTYLTDAVNTWLLEFMMGHKDPANDADWAAYIAELEALGLREVEALHKEVYERTSTNP